MTRAKTKTAEAQSALVIDNDPKAASVPAVHNGKHQAVAPAQPSGPDSLFAVIERAARDPSIDLSRMQELISMHKELKADSARAEYDMAMSAAQAEMKTIKTNKSNSHTKSKYASYEAMDKAIRPVYTKHGFALSFNTGDDPRPNEVRVLCIVSHRSGHRQEYRLDVPADGKGARGDDVMTKTHATGSAISYGKRYLAGMVFNLSVGDDDDGNSATSVAERAKTMADKGITHLNSMSPPTKEALAKWDAENAKAIAWLKKNSPEEFARYQIAYSNAAEAAGIPKEEPRRGNQNKPSKATSPHGGPAKGGQPASEDAAGAGSDRSPEAASKSAPITDVIEFDTFNTAREFLDFSSGFMADPKRTPAEAQQWHAHYKEKIDLYLKHEFPGKEVSWIRDSMTDTFAVYVKLTSAENQRA